MSDNQAPRTAARRQTLKGILWKIAIVVVAVLAYSGQKTLERTKKSYDDERSRPLVVVDDANAKQVARRSDFVALEAGKLKQLLPDQSGSSREVGKYIDRIKYQNFKDEKEIVDRINAEVLAESDLKKRAYLETRDALNKHRAASLTDLAVEKAIVYGRLQQLVSSDVTEKDEKLNEELVKKEIVKLRAANPADEAKIAKLRKIGADKVPASGKDLLAAWLNMVEKQIDDEQNVEVARQWIADVDMGTQEQIKLIYDKLRPELPRIVKEAKEDVGISPSSDTVVSFFDPRSVFNEKSGSHIIFQTLWLICVVVIVFFILFLFLAILRPLPYFATGSGTLMEQVGKIFNRPGGGGAVEAAAPSLARSLAVTAAALGVGTAVAVAGNGIIAKPSPDSPGSYSASISTGNDKQFPRTQSPFGGGSYTTPPKFELSPQIVYPKPTVIEHTTLMPSPDGGQITNLQSQVAKLIADNNNLSILAGRLQTQVGDIPPLKDEVGNLKKNVGDVNVPKLAGRTTSLEKDTDYGRQSLLDLSHRVGHMETDIGLSLDSLSTGLMATKQAIGDLRNSSLERTNNSGGRSFFTRAGQFFKPDRHMATNQSYEALKDLLCRDACDVQKTNLLAALKNQIGKPPTDASKFIKGIAGVDAATLKAWKPLILKYTRVPY